MSSIDGSRRFSTRNTFAMIDSGFETGSRSSSPSKCPISWANTVTKSMYPGWPRSVPLPKSSLVSKDHPYPVAVRSRRMIFPDDAANARPGKSAITNCTSLTASTSSALRPALSHCARAVSRCGEAASSVRAGTTDGGANDVAASVSRSTSIGSSPSRTETLSLS